MGQRVRNVMSELHGEKIDIVDWADDPARFVASALSPSRVNSAVVVDAQAKAVRVVVPDYQLSLAIGKEGQNARLAAPADRLPDRHPQRRRDRRRRPLAGRGQATAAVGRAGGRPGRPAGSAPGGSGRGGAGRSPGRVGR